MAKTLAARSDTRRSWLGWTAAPIGLALAIAIFGAGWLRHREQAIADAQAWTITGPPCPALTRQAARAVRLRVPQGLEYGGVMFARRFGHMSCAMITNDGGKGLGTFPVCQFTSPASLLVRTPRGEFYFAPGIGQPATVSVPHGVPRCVMASNFTARGDRT